MKKTAKTIAFILCLCLLAGVGGPGGVPAAYAAELPGDVNEDGTVDGRDTVRLMNYLAEETDPETGEFYVIHKNNADVNGDGKVDALDLARLVRYLGGEDVSLVNGKAENFSAWESRMPFPTVAQISASNRNHSSLPPYVQAWMSAGTLGRYSEFVVDFKADYVPAYTYCSLFNFYMDYSYAETGYARVHTDGGVISGYAGVQRGNRSEGTNSILSFWDVFCEDANGNVVNVIRPTLIYPEGEEGGSFDGEGTGAHYLPKYNWKPGRWYRMLMQVGVSDKTGNSTVQQWIKDLQTGAWTKMCEYDLGLNNLAFIGDCCVFLEGFVGSTSGEVRTLEFKNMRACREYSSLWEPITSGYFCEGFGHSGTFRYGTSGDTFWMISTGVTGIGPSSTQGVTLKVNGTSTTERP